MKTLLIKDFNDGLRNYKFIIILFVFIFFSMLNPIMTKFVLPQILKDQFAGMPEEFIASMVDTSQIGVIRAYIGDVFEVCILVVTFVLSGLISSELKEKTMIMSKLSNKSAESVVISKFIVYSLYITIVVVLASLINYIYCSVLFGNDIESIFIIIKSGFLQSIYFIYILSLIILIGSFFNKSMITGLITLIPAYGTRIIGNLLKVDKYLPSGLIKESLALGHFQSDWLFKNILITLSLVCIFILISITRLQSIEYAGR